MAQKKDQPAAVSKPKRTRVCVSQSRTGCLTCKARRVKCDEQKPTCLRCARSSRACEGYPIRVKLYMDGRDKPSPRSTETIKRDATVPLLYGTPVVADKMTAEQDRLAKLGCELIACDALYHFGYATGSLLDTLIPQFSSSIPCVHAAVAALGSVYELQFYPPGNRNQRDSFAARNYVYALRSLQQDLNHQCYGALPLLMASVLLAFSETIMNQPDNALLHLLGAYKILEDLEAKKNGAEKQTGKSSKANENYDPHYLALFFRALDYEAATFSLPRPPDLSVLPVELPMPPMTSITCAWAQIVPIVHSAYHFLSQACPFMYSPQLAPRELLIEQGRHIGHLSLWLEALDHDLLPRLSLPNTLVPSPEHAHALILRATCLSTLAILSMIFNPHEKAWDTQASRLKQIIMDGTMVVASKAANQRPTLFANSPRFSPGPGIIYPLAIAAAKYRNSRWRRHALHLIKNCGREGPYYGPRVSRIMGHVVAVEEAWQTFVPPASDVESLARGIHSLSTQESVSGGEWPLLSQSPPSSADPLDTIPERYLIRVSGFDIVARETPTCDYISTKFGRCRDVDGMVAAADPFVGMDLSSLMAAHQAGLAPSHNPRWWEVWRVTFKFAPGTALQKFQDVLDEGDHGFDGNEKEEKIADGNTGRWQIQDSWSADSPWTLDLSWLDSRL